MTLNEPKFLFAIDLSHFVNNVVLLDHLSAFCARLVLITNPERTRSDILGN